MRTLPKRAHNALPTAPLPDRGGIVADCKSDPPYSSGKTTIALMGRADFSDAAYWDGLAERYLPRYDLPPWDRPCSVEEMRRWLDRLDIPKKAWLRVGNYRDLADFSVLNPRWPLRAWIGLALELRAERESVA